MFALAARYSNFLPYGFCDVDGDGHLDALGGDNIGNTDVWKGRGDGTFDTTPVVTTSVAGSGIFGDVDGDGRCDLIVTTNAGTTVTMAVAHGQADATFKLSKVSIPGLKKPIIWYAGDLNHDGRLDLVVPATTAQGDLEYRTFLGQPSTPTADFSAALTVETFVASPGSAMGIQTPADVDGDGNPDIALPLIIGSSNTIAIAYGTGDGHFKTSAAPNIVGGLPTTPSLAALSDFDGDGKADVVVYSGATSPADQIFWSEGAGVFTAGPALSFTYMGDFDADGKLDVFGNAGSGNVDEGLIYLHSGPRSFRVYPNPYNSSALAVADVDGDGASDVALGTDLPGLSIFLSTAKHAGPATPDINCSPMPASACAGETSF